MPSPPPALLAPTAPFAPPVSRPVWRHASVLVVVGTILAPGRRTAAAPPRAAGPEQGRPFARAPRVLSRGRWSGAAVDRVPLGRLVAAVAPDGPLVVGVDETRERHRVARIAA